MCTAHGVPADLALALVGVESSWDPLAIRYEPTYAYFCKPATNAAMHHITTITETTLQKFSWGLLQVMGSTARDCGFKGPLQGLADVDTGLFWGLQYLARVCHRYERLEDRISAYNAGSVHMKPDGTYSNQEYVHKVLLELERNRQALER